MLLWWVRISSNLASDAKHSAILLVLILFVFFVGWCTSCDNRRRILCVLRFSPFLPVPSFLFLLRMITISILPFFLFYVGGGDSFSFITSGYDGVVRTAVVLLCHRIERNRNWSLLKPSLRQFVPETERLPPFGRILRSKFLVVWSFRNINAT